MRTHRRIGIAAAPAAATFAACSAGLRQPTAEDAALASARWPGTTAGDLQRGRALYVDRCAGCHNLPLPGRYAPEEWEGYVAYMAADAKLSPVEREAITRFLMTASARERGVPLRGAGVVP